LVCDGFSFDADGGFCTSQLKGVAYMNNTISKVCFVFSTYGRLFVLRMLPNSLHNPPSTRTKYDKQIEQLNLPEDTTILVRKGTYYGWPLMAIYNTRRGKDQVNVSLIL